MGFRPKGYNTQDKTRKRERNNVSNYVSYNIVVNGNGVFCEVVNHIEHIGDVATTLCPKGYCHRCGLDTCVNQRSEWNHCNDKENL